MGKKFRSALLYITAATLLVGIFSVIPFSAPALAAPTNEADCKAANGDWRATSNTGSQNPGAAVNYRCVIDATTVSVADLAFAYDAFVAMDNCRGGDNGNFKSTISVSDANSSNFFFDNKGNSAIGVLLKPTDEKGKGGCNYNWMPKAIKLWGWSSNAEFLCAIGYRQFDDSEKEVSGCGTTDYDYKKPLNDYGYHTGDINVMGTIQDKFYGGKEPVRTDAMRYHVYYTTLTVGCGATKAERAGPDVTEVWVYNRDTNSVEKALYRFNKNDEVTVSIEDGFYGDNRTRNCEQVADPLKDRKYADAYATEMQKRIDAEIATRCSEFAGDTNSQAYKDCAAGITADVINNSNPTGTDPLVPDQGPTCQAGAMGWILCPLVEGLSGLTDLLWTIVSSILSTNFLTGSSADTVRDTWRIFVNFANIVLAIGFLVLIYMMATGAASSSVSRGVTMKTALPRLILVAVAINLSFYICAAVVDLVNIIGQGIYDVFTAASPAIKVDWQALFALIIGGGAAGVAGVALAGGLSAAIWLLVPMVIMSVLAFLVALMTLWLRNVVILVLILISPLAFAAYILPNTQQWFSKWWKMFSSLLLMYPMAALLIGGASFVAGITSQAFDGWLGQLTALMIAAIPLFSLPFLVRSSGTMLSKIQGGMANITSKAKSPLGGVAKSHAEERKGGWMTGTSSRYNVGRRTAQRFDRSRRLRERKTARSTGQLNADFEEYMANSHQGVSSDTQSAAERERIAKETQTKAFRDALVTGDGEPTAFATRTAGITGDIDTNQQRLVAMAMAAQTREAKEAIENVKLAANIPPGDIDAMARAFQRAVKDGDSVRARAFEDMLATAGKPGVERLGAELAQMEAGAGEYAGTSNGAAGSDLNQKLRENLLANHGGVKAKDAALNAWGYSKDKETGEYRTLQSLQGDASVVAGLTDAEIVTQATSSAVAAVKSAVTSGAIPTDRAVSIRENENLTGAMTGGVREALGTTSGGGPTLLGPDGRPLR